MSAADETFRTKKPGQRACDVKNEKGKLCLGHLKRWYAVAKEVAGPQGREAEIYRCERCKALYRADPKDDSTAGQRYELRKVGLFGGFLRS